MLIRAARYLGVPPWELMETGIGWTELAYAAMQMDAEAEKGATVRAKRGKPGR